MLRPKIISIQGKQVWNLVLLQGLYGQQYRLHLHCSPQTVVGGLDVVISAFERPSGFLNP